MLRGKEEERKGRGFDLSPVIRGGAYLASLKAFGAVVIENIEKIWTSTESLIWEQIKG
ncbi:MAG: hypothetical protein LBQ27_01000 [Clostridiales bacterium]|jgi:hypothetical protein|nr:hypothetical protein [Clostridiales bacterium]